MESFFFHFRFVVVVELKMGHGKCVLMYLGKKLSQCQEVLVHKCLFVLLFV